MNATEPNEFYIVGIGASAGGLEALEQFFSNMPDSSGMAFVVVQHLSPDFKSLMDELLRRATDIPIRLIENEMVIKRNNIYLLPANQEVILSNGKLLLTERSPGRELSFPIDQFFRSLADDAGRRAVGVVLSGTGTDGSRGVCHIHEAGGLVLAQDEKTAKFDGMPRAAVDTGIVDVTLPADEISQALLTFAKYPSGRIDSLTTVQQKAMEGPMYTIFHLLKKQCGIDFSDYKTTTIGRRVQRRVMLARLPDLHAYVSVLRENPDEVDRLYKDLLIGVTNFFRDQDVFERLELEVIPNLMRKMKPTEVFRAWSVGTATGEEAYSLAILISEYFRSTGEERPVKIFATDVHRDSLEQASRAVYQEESLGGISPDRLERYFVRKDDGYHISHEIRKMVVCVPHNMVRDAPFTKMHLITCRNVLIYLTSHAQNKVLSLFHFSLNRDGNLCLGPSETLGELNDEFATVDEKAKIFRKSRDVPLPAATRLPVEVPIFELREPSTRRVPSRPASLDYRGLQKAYDVLLSEYMPPSLLTSKQGELLHVFDGAERFLHPPAGRVSTSLLDLVHADIRPTLSSALRRLRDEDSRVVFQGITCHTEDGVVELDLSAQSFAGADEKDGFCLIQLDPQERDPSVKDDRTFDAKNFSGEEVVSLENELQETRDNLQATIEQLQTTNEELQSANEQLIASNEELQSTNEELHSVNEELYTVNAEHQRKIDELTELTNDMDNLLASTNVHTIFLDRELRIRRFTPGIADTFNLIYQDVGRRIDSFSYNILDSDLVLEIKHVLEAESPFEREVKDRNDHWFLMRILPYLSGGQVDGVVLTLIDITSVKQAERKLAEVSEIVEHSDDAIMRLSTEGIITTWNAGAEKLFGFSRTEIIGKSVSTIVPAEHESEAQSVLSHVVEGAAVDRFESRRLCKDGTVIDVSLTLSPIRNESGNVVGASEIVRDVTAQKIAEAEVREAVRNRDQFLAMLSHELRNPMAAVLNATTLMKEEGIDESTSLEAQGVIERNVRHVARLLDDLLDLSRFTHDKITLHRQVVDLNEMAMDVVECVQPLVDEKNQQLHVEKAALPIFIEGDIGRIQQAQVNLLVNASKYTRTGGRIDYQLTRDGEQACISVSDNGIGISDDFLEDIFQPFVQSDRSLDRSQGGMGLGLPLVRMIVEAHGGTIEAESGGIGQGSKFAARLPVTKSRPLEKSNISPSSIAGRRMLIVEDNSGIRKMLAASMRLKGFEVATAEDGGKGFETIVDFEPQIALIDVGLPDVNGYELARMIRNKPEFEGLLLVAITGYGRENDRQEAMAAGFDLHLVKPLDPNEVLLAISEFVGGLSRHQPISE